MKELFTEDYLEVCYKNHCRRNLKRITYRGVAGKIVRSPYGVMHGKSSPVYYDEKGEDGLFTGLSK